MSQLESKVESLLSNLRQYESCAVAYSGGVDSAVVAKAACLALGDQAIAVTSVSPSLASGELELAQAVAMEIGIRHMTIETDEFENPLYLANAGDRCFYCKNSLYSSVEALDAKLNVDRIVNGTNVDDLGDYRPGLKAASLHRVASPLAECGLSKTDVRELAKYWKLSVAEKPASPCLSSRVAYGEKVTAEKLAMIDSGEQMLRKLGFSDVRVRYHAGDLARVEVAIGEVPRLCEQENSGYVTQFLRKLGFRFVTIDLEGFRSGNLNQIVQIDSLGELTD